MKGVILCGGLGTRLAPLTDYINKHVAIVYDRPMVYYPIQTLVKAGITDVAVVVSGQFSGQIISLIKDGKHLGLKRVTYLFQNGSGGIADALALAEDFADNDNICVILGDNTTDFDIAPSVVNFDSSKQFLGELPTAKVFLKKVDNPSDFGVAELNEIDYIVNIVEKPAIPKSNLAVTGLYLYDRHVFDFIKQCVPSERGQLEITSVNNLYLHNGRLFWDELKGFWQDAGTMDNLYKANKFWYELKNEPKI